ncbi:cell wall-binding repeat-containing protein [Euzebya sp.]|uniref:cell wall-binding repeat-containing protein n=1 Tax=Euzebya sp. TaxID=1971409 RepID=UPI00351592A6
MPRSLAGPAVIVLSLLALVAALLAVGASDASAQGGFARPDGDEVFQQGTEKPPPPLIVNTEEDSYDGECDPIDAAEAECSIRDAIHEANDVRGGHDTITFADGIDHIVLTRTGDGGVDQGDLDITQAVAIIDAEGVVLDASGLQTQFTGGDAGPDRVMHVSHPLSPVVNFAGTSPVDLVGLTLQGGSGVASGGGLLVDEGTWVEGTSLTLRDNSAGVGGGAAVQGRLTLTGSTVEGNSAIAYGGGLYTINGTVELVNSTVTLNVASDGGGLTADTDLASATLVLVHATVLDNEAVGISSFAGLTERADNILAFAGGSDDAVNLTANYSVIQTDGPNSNCRFLTDNGTVTVEGAANATNDESCELDASGNVVDVTNTFGPLADNGGLTRTRALLAGSEAIDAIDVTSVPGFAQGTGSCAVELDQRGVSRPQDGPDADTTPECDRGAFEFVPQPSNPENPGSTPTPQPEPTIPPVQVNIDRCGGETRTETATECSEETFPDGADAVVLARADDFPDAQAGAPLAVELGAPILLTQTDVLSTPTADEIERLLEPGGTVYLLGGTEAISQAVEDELIALGYEVIRYGGENRYATAVVIATEGLGSPGTALIADGGTFTDAIAAGAAAVVAGDSDFAQDEVGAAVLLTAPDGMPAETAAYLAEAKPDEVIAIGDRAGEVAGTEEIVTGDTPAALSVAVAERFFTDPAAVGIATDAVFVDALTGSSIVGNPSVGPGPMLFTDPEELSPEVEAYLVATAEAIDRSIIFGGIEAVSTAVEDAIIAALGGDAAP